MKKFENFMEAFKKISIKVLALVLVLGILSSCFGVVAAAVTTQKKAGSKNPNELQNSTPGETGERYFESPTEQFEDIGNEVSFNENVHLFSDTQSRRINNGIMDVQVNKNYYDEQYLNIKLSKAAYEQVEDLPDGTIIYLSGDESTPFGGDQIFKIIGAYSTYGDDYYLNVSQPYFEEVFESIEICTSDLLTEENFVRGYYADGVSAHFGNAQQEIVNASHTEQIQGPVVHTLSASQEPTVVNTATDYSTEDGDLIVTIDYTFKEKNKETDHVDLKASFGIKGSYGIRDLTAHLVCDMDGVADFNELYFGVSGETFLDIDVYGGLSAEAEPEATELDLGIMKLEGLNNKRFPIAVFEFQGTTPVYITNKAFENKKESVLPSLFVILYADWEGKISLELQGGFEYTHAFNNGLRVFKDGEICLNFEEYPYESPLSAESEDGFVWDASLTLDADTDLTVLGGSVLFFVAGINIGEFSIARLGIQAQCELSLAGNSRDGVKILDNEDTKYYVRGYLKIVEVKLKLVAEGKAILEKLKIDKEFEFALLDLELFEFGHRPDKYVPSVPVSSMERPEEFESVMSLVCDVSGSMDSYVSSGQTKLAAAKDAAKTIVDISRDWAEQYVGNYGIGVIKFASYAETVALPHIDYDYINDCIDSMYDGGGTRICDGIDAAVAQLEGVQAKNKTIILMTDGQDGNDSGTLASAQVAADLGIKIYTIGFGNDVNEDILMQVAELTGGEYRFASTEDLLGIESSFMYAQQASNAKVLDEVEGTLSEGEVSEGSHFYVQEGNGNLMVATTWPGSFMETILIDPNGRRVDENYPGATVDESKIPSSIVVTNPIQGRWSVRVKGVETSYDNEPFYTIVSYKATKSDKVNKEMSQLQQIAAYCIPVGIVAAVASGVLLSWLRKMEKSKKKERTTV